MTSTHALTHAPTHPHDTHPRESLPALRTRLEERWREHVAEITRLSLDALDAPRRQAENSTAHLEHLAMASRLIATERQRLEEVEAALKRVDDETYGRCQQCLRPISADRLEAAPAVRYCASCQS